MDDETKICPGCEGEMSRFLTVCWDCFKYRGDVMPFKYFEGSLEEWVASLSQYARRH